MQNNPLTEIFLGIGASLLILGAIILLYFGKIDGTFAVLMFGAAATLFGGNLALKAPSPTQQAQIGTLADRQQLLTSQQQGLTSQVLSVLPTMVAAVQQPQPQPTVAPAQAPGPKDWIMTPTGQTLPPVPQAPSPFVSTPFVSTPQGPQQPFPQVPEFTAPLEAMPRG
jgi:hypothetical protein